MFLYMKETNLENGPVQSRTILLMTKVSGGVFFLKKRSSENAETLTFS
jgi:hypothetical protein